MELREHPPNRAWEGHLPVSAGGGVSESREPLQFPSLPLGQPRVGRPTG